jgi:hypothetical protein
MPAKETASKNSKLWALSLPDQLDACPVNFRKEQTETGKHGQKSSFFNQTDTI